MKVSTISRDVSTPTGRRHPRLRKLLIVLGIVIALVVIQTLPVFLVSPVAAREYRSSNAVVIYSAGDETGAREIFDLVNTNVAQLKAKMQLELARPLEIYVYKNQSSLFIREAGLITLVFAPKWFIGDSEAGVIKMVSPNTPVQGHTHETIVNATLHEVVHSINYYRNPKIAYFWDNGLATYLAKQVPAKGTLAAASMPSVDQMHTDNGLTFGNYGGYAYSYSYIEFLDKTYGWDKVLEYAAGGKGYEAVFGKSEQALYDEWARYLKG